MRLRKVLLILFSILMLSGCRRAVPDTDGADEKIDSPETVQTGEAAEQDESGQTPSETEVSEEAAHPSKEQVLAAREVVWEGMTEEQTKRLTENIKIANLAMEHAYLYDNIFAELEDKDSLLWNYFDQKGDIQVGWSGGAPVMVYNRFDANNFIDLIADMRESVQNEALRKDLQRLIDETALARDTHEAEHAETIYKILHDMDYYLFRYGPEDVGKYVKDTSTIAKYYGMLTIE